MGGDQNDTRPMDEDDMSDEIDGGSEEGLIKPAVRPAPVARASEGGNQTLVDLTDDDLENAGSLGDLPPPVTVPGATMRITSPPAPKVGIPSLTARPAATPKLSPSLSGTPPTDPSDATSAFTKEGLKRMTDEEDGEEAPNPNASALLDQPKSDTPEPPQDRSWYEGAPAAPIPVEAQWVDDEPVLTSASDRRPFYIGVGLAAVAAVLLIAGSLAFTGGGLGLYAWFSGGGQGGETAVAAMPPIAPDPILVVPPPVPEPEPEKAPEEAQAPVTTSHEYFVAVSPQTVLATVNVGRKALKCTIVEYEETAFTAANLEWPNMSHYERWEICAPDLRKGPSSDGGGFMLIAGEGEGVTINLKEVIATEGGADYTPLTSTPSALARCWGSGQVNGGGQPTCTKKPPQVAENASAATLPAIDKQ